MSDIVERLRATAAGLSRMHQHEHDEAADEIERLRTLVARYLELDVFDCDAPVGKSDALEFLESAARRALGPKP